ncbi:hypothetical protein HGRIS_013198 [Hohenbuehelia grisea]|uniref:rRNA-processing protein FYV7 n=1 Tax=Hohenbuehelia grisea TaxID=104357 RepID=A0ABR3IUV0_9AGAR
MPETAGTKRKRPPTFQHYPENRAKKLKEAWVQKTKIKSKWKAEKRKAEIATPRLPTVSNADVDDEDAEDTEHKDNSDRLKSRASQDLDIESSDTPADTDQLESEAQPDEPPTRRPSKKHKPLPPSQLSRRPSGFTTHRDPRPSERNPKPAGKAQSAQEIPRSRKERAKFFLNKDRRESPAERNRKRQPDMKLRMNAMLEKIKKDFV